jgi:allantoin racemase
VYHLWEKCASIRAVDIPPDAEALFAGKEDEMFRLLTDEANRAITEDGAGVILLGSTTMHRAGDYMAEHLPVPVINPGPVAIKIVETIVQLGLTHSKADFAAPSTIIDDRFFSLGGAS